MSRTVGVVGAGPGGLAAAIALKRLGFNVLVFEQAPHMENVGGGILLHSNGLRVLDALGVLPLLEPKLRFSSRMNLEAAGGHVLLGVDYSRLPVPHPHCAVVLRYDLVNALKQTAEAVGVNLLLSQTFCYLTPPDEKSVTLTFTDDRENPFATYHFDAAVACDGVHSPIRAALGLGQGEPAPLPPWLRTSSPVRTSDDTIREIWGDDGRGFGIMPLPGSETHFFCSAPPKNEWDALLADPAGLQKWVESWAGFGPDVLEMVRAVPNWHTVHYGSPALVEVRAWFHDRIFLVGDAAHAMPPNLGQGANAALVDALVLARVLADTVAHAEANAAPVNWESAGRTYQSIRGPFMRQTQQAARELGFLSHQTIPLMRRLRDEIMTQSARIAPLRDHALQIAIGHNPPEDVYLGPLA